MHKIRSWLYVSNYTSARDKAKLKKHGIQGMLQLYQPIEIRGVESVYVGLHEGTPIRPEQLETLILFIRDQRRKQHTILSTCGAGVSRSAMLAIVALKELEGLSLFEAYRDVRNHHRKATPDHVHWKSVADHYGEDLDFWSVWGDVTLLDG